MLFNLGDNCYRIERVFEIRSGNTQYVHCKRITLDLIDNQQTPFHVKSNLSTSVSAIDQWVQNKIGDFKIFIMSCLITQSSDYDFFDMKDADQLKLFDEILHLESLEHMTGLFKETILALTALQRSYQVLKSQLSTEVITMPEQAQIEQLKETMTSQTQQLNQTKNDLSNLKESWHHLKESDLLLSQSVIQEHLTQA